MRSASRFAKRVAAITGNVHLAADIHESLSRAIKCRLVHLPKGKTPLQVFERSLDQCIRDIETHPHGKLFQRLLLYGPPTAAKPEGFASDGETILTDEECQTCVEFIYSHMINRFKGEVAELLAVGAVVNLVHLLIESGRLPRDIQIFWGDTVEERRRVRRVSGEVSWGSFCKGADGLLVRSMRGHTTICGIVEVKSMARSLKQIGRQIRSHIARMHGGLRLCGKDWHGTMLTLPHAQMTRPHRSGLFHIAVVPSLWKLSREWSSVEATQSRRALISSPHQPPRVLVFQESPRPSVATAITEANDGTWKITLRWSAEALAQAAFEMTFWYMSQVGTRAYNQRTLPETWKHMSTQQAGQNAIKQALYFILVRYLSDHAYIRARRLYNVYSFGYPLGVDSDEILAPSDFPEGEHRNVAASRRTKETNPAFA